MKIKKKIWYNGTDKVEGSNQQHEQDQKTKKSEKEDCIMLIIKERMVEFEVETRDWCDA